MKPYLKLSALLILIILCASWFQKPLSFGDSYASEHDYPADFPKIIRPVDASFTKDSLLADSLFQKIWKFYGAGQWDSMLTNGQALQHVGERLLEQKFNKTIFKYWGYGHGTYGQALLYLGEIEKGSMVSNENFLIGTRVLGDSASVERAATYFGAGYMALDLFGDPDLALDFFRLGESTSRKILKPGDIRIWSHLMNLGIGYWIKGDYATSIGYLHQILQMDGMTPWAKFSCYDEWSDLFFDIEDYENALNYALLAQQEWHDPSNALAQNEIQIARCFLKLKNIPACKEHIEKCEQIVRENKFESKGYQIGLLQVKSDYLFAIKDYEHSILLKQSALEVAEKSRGGKYSLLAIQILHDLVKTYLETGNLTDAQTTISELLFREAKQFHADDFTKNPEVTRFTRQPYHLQTLLLKGIYHEREYLVNPSQQSLQNALSTYLLADSLIDYIRDSYRGNGSKNQLAGQSKPIYQHGIDCAYQLWSKTGQQQFLDNIWYFSEKSKSVQMLESLRESEAKQTAALRPEEQFRENRIKRDINFFEKLVYEEQAKPQPNYSRISGWNQKTAVLKNAMDSLLVVFQKRYPEYHRLKYNRQVASIAETQAKLPDSTAFISYFLGDSILFSILLDHSQCKVYRQVLDSGFQQNISLLHQKIHEFNPESRRSNQQKAIDFQAFTTASFALFQTLLFRPLQQTSARKLIVVPDENIGYIPFPALLTQEIIPAQNIDYRNLPYLVRGYAVRLAYSGTLLQEGKTANGTGAYLGIAPVYSGSLLASRGLSDSLRFSRAFADSLASDLSALRYNSDEVNASHNLYGGSICTGIQASESFFKKNASRAGILHLSMHALANDIDPMYSTLVFSGIRADSSGENDGFLHAYELYNLHLKADLVVLSACHTGAGKIVKGEGIMSLARAFKFAGCPNILMSLWAVDDLAGKNLIVDFFQYLHAGSGKATALQSAQNNFLNNTRSDDLMHPYYWSTFVLVGNDSPVHVNQSDWFTWLLFVLVLGLLGVILFGKNREYQET